MTQHTMLVHVTPDTIDVAEQLRQRLQRAYLALGAPPNVEAAQRIGVESELDAIVEACHELAGRIFKARRKAEGRD